ncbi:MAG: 1-(5-phosphoribosyl)-5-[(5-phosphoribosylamino)methylideneamino]imidazole-4-carboxamide isomerase [Firmicutes bacterium]|nr:1-(5-phosphoribosyl)-5-[(5-phosphoribosylamino)methylideneamino]imidazole-4-carboxamide isomerase [Bacillota bacterium]
MVIYPAIDILVGKCVRLSQGDYSKSVTYSEKPEQIAAQWEKCGAKYLHIVDLDGARRGMPTNTKTVEGILKSVKIPIQLGGGIRTIDDIDMYIKMGVSRVILGTSAVQSEGFIRNAVLKHQEKIAVGIDAKDGFAATNGWEKVSSLSAFELAGTMYEAGVKTIIYTDIATDGMLRGPNIAAMKEMADSVPIDIIASGGVACIDDVERLKKTGVSGVIIGKALYSGNIELEECICRING